MCRKASAELREVKNTTVLEGFDVSNDGVMAQIRDCKELPNALDIIIANAGVLERNSFNEIQSTESLMKQFNTNSLGEKLEYCKVEVSSIEIHFYFFIKITKFMAKKNNYLL